MKYRKLPVVIDAMQFNNNVHELLFWAGSLQQPGDMKRHISVDLDALSIHTLEGIMRAEPLDFIIRGVSGEFYPCKPDIFAKIYEPVTSDV